MSDIIKVNATEMAKCISTCWANGLVPMLHGSPGLGKSSIIHQLAEKYKLKLIDIRLSQCDPVDLSGFPMMGETGRGVYAPMEMFPLEGDPIPEGYRGWVISFDEINTAAAAIQAASYKVILDKMVGQKKLHSKVFMAAAGNLMTDAAIVNRLSTAMQSRLIHFELQMEHKPWSIWASQNQLSPKVIGYINANPQMLHQFDPMHNDKTFPCPRTWHFAAKIIANNNHPELLLALLSGTVGKGAAVSFLTYDEVYKEIPQFDDILQAPETITISKEPAALAALSSIVGANMTLGNAAKLMHWVMRLGIEFQTFCMRDAVHRTPGLYKTKEVEQWAIANAKALV